VEDFDGDLAACAKLAADVDGAKPAFTDGGTDEEVAEDKAAEFFRGAGAELWGG